MLPPLSEVGKSGVDTGVPVRFEPIDKVRITFGGILFTEKYSSVVIL